MFVVSSEPYGYRQKSINLFGKNKRGQKKEDTIVELFPRHEKFTLSEQIRIFLLRNTF